MTALLLALALAQAPAPELYAVAVGFNGGLPASSGTPLPELRFADDDALRLARWFSAVTPAQNVFVLAEPDAATRATWQSAGLPLPELRAPTRSNLFATLDEVQRALEKRPKGREAVVVFFYAGHGLTGRLLLAPEASGEAGLTGRELRAAAARLSADRVLVLLDACRSQSLFVERGEKGPDLTAEIRALEAKAGDARVGVLTAAASDRPAGEAGALQGGFFSHVLASGLAGAADADADGVVRFGELAAFVAFNTERLTGQRPWFEPPNGDLRAPVVSLEKAAGVVLPLGAEGRVRVSSTSGTPLFAEVNKSRRAPMKLALPPGHYRVVKKSGDARGLAAEVEVAAGASRALGDDAFGQEVAWSGGPLERGDAAYEAQGFAAPFTSDAVAALEVGYSAGQQPTSAGIWSHAFDAAFSLGPAPLGLPALEQGVDVGYRWSPSWVVLGARASFRGAAFPQAGLFRLGLMAQGGVRLRPAAWFEVSVLFSAGVKSLWIDAPQKTSGDIFVPAFGGGLRAELRATSALSLWLEGRFETSFPRVDSARIPSGEPAGLLGFSFRQ